MLTTFLIHYSSCVPFHTLYTLPFYSPSFVSLGWFEGQGLGGHGLCADLSGEGALPWLSMVQTLARDIHTPHSGGGGSAFEAVAARLAGAMVLTMQVITISCFLSSFCAFTEVFQMHV